MNLNLYLVPLAGVNIVVAAQQKVEMLRLLCDNKVSLAPTLRLCDLVIAIRAARKIGITNQYIKPLIIGL